MLHGAQKFQYIVVGSLYISKPLVDLCTQLTFFKGSGQPKIDTVKAQGDGPFDGLVQ